MNASGQGWYLPEIGISPVLSAKKAASLAEALELLQLKPQEALQVKSYILDPTGEQNQSCCVLQNRWFMGWWQPRCWWLPAAYSLILCSGFPECKSEATDAVIYLDFTHLEDLDLSSEKGVKSLTVKPS